MMVKHFCCEVGVKWFVSLMLCFASRCLQSMGGAPTSGYGLFDGKTGDDCKDLPIRGGTLVVCPTAVLRQWENELKQKVHPAAGVTVRVYHGTVRGVFYCMV